MTYLVELSLDDYSETSVGATASATRIVGQHYEDTPSISIRVKRYYAGGALLATRTGTTLTYVQGDHLGSTTTLTDGGGAVVSRERYSAFGERRRTSDKVITDQLYTGQRLNVLSNLYHYSDGTSAGRFYDPLLARFVQADSVTPPGSQGLNRYTYADNSPVVFTDPSGHAAWKDEYEGDYGSPAPGFVPNAVDYNGWYFRTWEQAHGTYQGVANDPYLNSPSYVNEGYPSADGLANSVSLAASSRANQRLREEANAGYVSFETVHAAIVEVGPALLGMAGDLSSGRDKGGIRRIEISRSKYPEAAQHIEDAQAAGHPSILEIDRSGKKARRAEALRDIPKVPGKELDEYPPAMFKEGGKGASVRPIDPSQNAGAGACIGNTCRPYSDGTRVEIVVVP